MSAAAPRKSSLQALLDKQAAPPAPEPVQVAEAESVKPEKAAKPKFSRPSREGTKFVGGHFPPKVAKELKLLAVTEDTSTQALLEEAIDLLFVKKGRGRIIHPERA
ncbi:ribbon-helix-helix domain-containing protein [Methylobacterium sp. WSM2598]|uniref:ribbon-helix-helix domain-containing protein n=1 Tax=Methylobacterium sp. WSM2598 TaxID=398261 RepID=UPI000363A621|nr:ribbon-helix-helix domain-containing protein [Methylobacterium sp. WSM2598]